VRLYYNTNGFAHHRLEDAVEILADLGYDGIALTPDMHHLDPLTCTPNDIEAFRTLLESRGLGVTIEGGARFVLDARRKHWPTLLTADGFERRQDFYRRLIDIACDLGSPLVSLWSGSAEPDTPKGDEALKLLAGRLEPVLRHAQSRGLSVCLEPEPGMLVEHLATYRKLKTFLPEEALPLTLDVGHLAASEEPPYDAHVRASARDLAYVHADDSPVGRHEHRMFGEGDLDFQGLSTALREIGYAGIVAVELSRHGHQAPQAASQAIGSLRAAGF